MKDQPLLAAGFEKAFIGYVERCGQPAVAIYDREKCIGILQRKGMPREEAEEFFEFNVGGAWVGEGTPGFLVRCTLRTFKESFSE